MPNPILVALDVPTAAKATVLVEQLAPVVAGFKIGSELFTSSGPEIVRQIRGTGASIFLDLKFRHSQHGGESRRRRHETRRADAHGAHQRRLRNVEGSGDSGAETSRALGQSRRWCWVSPS
jgi:hypothetical protein